MAYSYQSTKYLIPAMVTGNFFSQTDEMSAVDRVDRHLNAGLMLSDGTDHVVGTGVISEGTYTGNYVSGSSSVSLNTLRALIEGIYVYTTSPVSWLGLSNDTTYYLYATLVETATASSRRYGHWVASQNVTGITPAHSILLATAYPDSGTGSVTIVSDPDTLVGKIPFRDIYWHRNRASLDHPTGSVHSAHIASGAIETAHIASAAVEDYQIASGAIETAHIATAAIEEQQISSGSVTTAHLRNRTIVDEDIDITEVSGSVVITSVPPAGSKHVVVNHVSSGVFVLFGPLSLQPVSSGYELSHDYSVPSNAWSADTFCVRADNEDGGAGGDCEFTFSRLGVLSGIT